MRTIIILFFFFITTLAYGQWESESNNLTSLPKEEQKSLLGAEEPQVGPYTLPVDKESLDDLPQFHDWRNYRGNNYLTPVRSQGKCGSCVVFAAIGAFEAQINIANDWPNLDLDLSEQEVLSCGGGTCSGWQVGFGIQQLVNEGAIAESYFPYLSGSIAEDLACKEFQEEDKFKARTFQFIGHKAHMDYNHGIFEVIPVTKRRVIEALLKGPLATSMTVWEDILSYKQGIYRHQTGVKLGGHAVVIVGYSLEENYWIIRNSWGSEWGEAGYFRIDMNDEDSRVANYNYQLEVVPFDQGSVAIINHEERKILSSRDKVKIETSFKYALKTTLLVKKDGKIIKKIPTLRENWLFSFANIDQRDIFKTFGSWDNFKDGIYQIQAKTYFYNGGFRARLSSPVEMMIIKKRPDIKISIKGFFKKDEQLNLLLPVDEKIYVEMKIDFSQVPPQRVELVMEHENGEVIVVKNNKPAKKTYLGWRTSLSNNGRYRIFAKAIAGNFVFTSQSFEIVVNNQ